MSGSRLRLIRAATAVVIVFVLLLFVAHTGPVRNWAREAAARYAEDSLDDARVDIGALTYRLWRGELTAESLALDFSIPEAGIVVNVGAVRVRWRPWAGVRLVIDEPDVRVRMLENDDPTAPSKRASSPSAGLPSWLVRIEVHDGRASFIDAATRAGMELGPIDAVVDASAGLEGEVLVGGGEASFGGERIELYEAELRASGTATGLSVDRFAMMWAGARITAAGRLDTLDPVAGSVEGEYIVDGDALARLGIVPGLAGSLSGTAQASFDGATWRATGDLISPELWVHDLGPWNVQASVTASDDAPIEGHARVDGYDGRFDAQGTHDPTLGGQQTIRGTFDGFRLQPVLADATDGALRWDGAVEGRFAFETRELDVSRLDGEGELRFVPAADASESDVRGAILVDGSAGALLWKSNGLAFPGGSASVAGTRSSTGELSSRFRIAVDEPSQFGLLNASQEPLVRGAIVAEGELNGRTDELTQLRVNAQLEAEALTIAGDTFRIDGRVELENGLLQVRRLDVASRTGGFVSVDGTLGVANGRPSDISALVREFSIETMTRELDAKLHGVVSGEVRMTGSLSRPVVDAQLELGELQHGATAFPELELEGRVEDERAHAILRRRDGQQMATLDTQTSGRRESRLEVDIGSLPIESLLAVVLAERPALRNRSPSLEATGTMALTLALDEPASTFHARVELERLSAGFDELAADATQFTLEATPESVRVNGLHIRGDGVDLLVDGELPLDGSAGSTSPIMPTVKAQGHVELDVWSPLVPAADVGGVVRFELETNGAMPGSELLGTITLDDARFETDRLSLSGDGRVTATGKAFEIDAVELHGLGGSLRADGVLPLPWHASSPATTVPESARFRFEIDDIDVARLALAADGDESVETSSPAEIRVSMNGELHSVGMAIDAVSGSGAVTDVVVVTAAGRMALRAPASWSLDEGLFRQETLVLVGPDTELSVGARGELFGEASVWSANVRGHSDLGLFEPFVAPSVFVSGPMRLDVDVEGGNGGSVQLNGSAEVTDAELVVDTPLLVISDLGGTIRFNGTTIELELASTTRGRGNIEATGHFDLDALDGYGDGSGGDPVRMELQADDIRLEYPEDMRSNVSVDIALRGSTAALVLSGDVRVHEAMYTSDVSPTRELLRSLRSGGGEFLREQGLAERVRLNLDVETIRDMALDNNLGKLRADVNLVVTGTASLPELTGTVRARPGGEIVVGGNEYEIQAARVDLLRYPSRAPQVEIQANTEAGGRELILELSGPLDNLRTSLRSPTDPSVSRGDAASLLLTGRTTDEVRGNEGEVLGAQAASMLGRGIAGVAERGLGDALPVTSVNVDPTLVGRETDPGVRFSLGQAVAEDLFLTYSIGLNDTEGQLWIVDYALPRRLQVRAVRSDANEYTGELAQEVELDLYDRNRPSAGQGEAPDIDQLRLTSVSGADDPVLHTIVDVLELDEGDSYDYWEVREDAERLTRALRTSGYLSARVDFYEEEAAAGSAGVDVVYSVDRGKTTRIEWRGDDPGRDAKSLVDNGWSGFLPPRAMARRLAPALIRELRSQRYYRAAVTETVTEEDNAVHVVFDVALGERAESVVLVFDGNEAIPDDALSDLFPPVDSPEFFELVYDDPATAREGVELLYAVRGYYLDSVSGPAPELDEGTGELRVRVTVEEGGPAYVRRVAFRGGDGIPAASRSEAFSVREGARFYLDEYIRARGELTASYHEAGYVDASISTELVQDGGEVEIVIDIDQGEQHRVGEIEIVGARITNQSLIRNAATFEAGEALSLSSLHETQRRLYDLGIFRSVDVRASEASSPQRDVVIDLEELRDLRFAYGLRYSTEDRWEVSGGVTLRNLLGTARSLSFDGFVNRNDRIYRGTFHMPTLAGTPIDTDLFVEKQLETNEDFRSDAWKFTAQQSQSLRGSGLRLQWGYSFRRASVVEAMSSGPFGFDVQVNRATLTTSLIHDSRTSLSAPTAGSLWSTTVQFAPTQLGSDIKLLRLYAQLFEFRSIGRGIVWASSYRAGIANGFDQVLLRQDRFRAGGANSVRGYPHDGLGPPDPRTGSVLGGEGVIVLNQELRIPVWGPFGAVVFVDAGNVFLDYKDFKPFDLKTSIGIGGRVTLPVGIVRIDWARVLNPLDGFDRTQLYFSLGHAF